MKGSENKNPLCDVARFLEILRSTSIFGVFCLREPKKKKKKKKKKKQMTEDERQGERERQKMLRCSYVYVVFCFTLHSKI
ncbi:hypothetical protein I7I53_06845 [Histoplasma capsulatum var. duboisii H88]|uniref:Uncharacterized protein n=1 Tax=Ajellomyces capsulatus (strain H88) TaxID=544711 RepID=A0A8A1LC53_AJEC8|nr:hypothetical protein I7I53_06845 [Histoplasma capsulatum var. duboisii H88]